jgi:hypothetical protein
VVIVRETTAREFDAADPCLCEAGNNIVPHSVGIGNGRAGPYKYSIIDAPAC